MYLKSVPEENIVQNDFFSKVFSQSWVFVYFATKGRFEMNMYKTVYMILPNIYDTAFCNDLGNMKNNHISCNMTYGFKKFIKNLQL